MNPFRIFPRPAFLSLIATVTAVAIMFGGPLVASAAAPQPQNPQNGSMGVEGTVPAEPPKQGATITTPANGQVFTKIPVRVSGLCPNDLLVKVFSNNVFVGSTLCSGGSYSLEVDLLSGRNDLVVRVFDTLDQPGPDSNTITVTFNDSQFTGFTGSPVILTSDYARRGANPGQTLTWPIIVNGGTPPYAISVDWGDGKPSTLLSRQENGTVDLTHVYDQAGTYKITVRATDKNGLSAYLQLVGVANGAVSKTDAAAAVSGDTGRTKVLWAPAAATVPLVFVAFWLGRRYELAALRKHLENLGKNA